MQEQWREDKRFKAREIPSFNHEKFFKRIRKDESCWTWIGSLTKNGYGTICINGSNFLAHRVSYTIHKGKAENFKVIDHICRNRLCVNPEHLRMVDHRTNAIENSEKEDLRKRVLCKAGHEFNEKNTYINKYGGRQCRICKASNEIKRKSFIRKSEIEKLQNRNQELHEIIENGISLITDDKKFLLDIKTYKYDQFKEWIASYRNKIQSKLGGENE